LDLRRDHKPIVPSLFTLYLHQAIRVSVYLTKTDLCVKIETDRHGEAGRMKKKGFTPERIINMLREAEVLLSLSDGTLHSPEKAMFNE
jgi:hypothetical protein